MKEVFHLTLSFLFELKQKKNKRESKYVTLNSKLV